MEQFFLRAWWVLALRGAAAILFGVLALAWPGLTLLTLIYLFAAYALIAGCASVAGALRHRQTEDEWWVPMLLGLVSIGAGIVAVRNPALTTLLLVLLIGANALVAGVLDLVAATRLRQAVSDEWLLVLSGLASIVFGAVVFGFPAAGALTLVWMVSLYAVVAGALWLTLSLRMRARAAAGADARMGDMRTSATAYQTHAQDRRLVPDRRTSPAR